jgi:hypothetical protein
MGASPGRDYHPLWLTAEEYQTLFGELLEAPEGFKAERVAELLRRAEARASGVTSDASSWRALAVPSPGAAAARRMLAVLGVGTALLAAVALYLLLGKR